MTDAPGPSASGAVSSAAKALAALEAAARVLAETRSVLVIDWPSRDVPASLAFAGFTVFVKGGPGPADYNVWEIDSGEPTSRPLGREPSHLDLVYCHRPLRELPGIIALAGRLGARALWWQTGLASDGSKDPSGCWAPAGESGQARELAAAAGLAYIDDVYIADAVRALAEPPGHQGG
jgi:predicted CoA-binding protein